MPSRSFRRPRTAREPLERALTIGMAGARIAIGACIWARPGRALGRLGFDPCAAEVRALGRLAATRDLALGGLALAARDDAATGGRVALVNALVDLGDATAFAIALARREGIDRAAVGGFVSAAAAGLAGLYLARRGS